MTSARDLFDAAADTWQDKEAPRLWRKLPQQLFHYTSGPGFHGILSSGQMWGSNFAFMNDRSEHQHSRELVQRCLRALGGTIASEPQRQFLDHAVKSTIYAAYDVYLACF